MKTPWQIARAAFPWLGLLCVVGLLAGGCQTRKKNFTFSPLPESDSSNLGSYNATNHFVVGELITVRFADTNQIPLHEERIKEDGTVTLALIGAVKAAGKTPDELQREIHELYVPRYYKSSWVPGIQVQRMYYVGGQVNQPGRQVYLGPTTVTKAIESAGGFTEFTKGTRVELTRNDGKRFIINCVKAAKDTSLDLPVYPGDKISVPMQWVPDIFR